jgi:DNA adenine methylase
MSGPTRPVLRWHGGKWILAPWIISHFGAHRVYVEPYGGAASVLMRKPRAYAEVYNDLDGELVNLFRVLRSDGAALVEAIRLTLYAREELVLARLPDDCPIERARRCVVRSFMGFGSDSARMDSKTGFRSDSNRSGSTPAHDWANLPSNFDAVIERLRRVVIENKSALEVMADHDGPATLHYVDPPYVHETRGSSTGAYAHEMSVADHEALLAFLLTLQGQVVLSGYPSPLYDVALAGWKRCERAALADGAKPRTEVVWINRRAVDLFNVQEVAA